MHTGLSSLSTPKCACNDSICYHLECTLWYLGVVHQYPRLDISQTEVIHLPNVLHPATHVPFWIPSSDSSSHPSLLDICWHLHQGPCPVRWASWISLVSLLSLLFSSLDLHLNSFLNYCYSFLPAMPVSRVASAEGVLSSSAEQRQINGNNTDTSSKGPNLVFIILCFLKETPKLHKFQGS